jgi:hypothetical protein
MPICELTWDAIYFNAATMHVTRKNGQPTTHRIRGDELRALRKLYGATAIAEISIFASTSINFARILLTPRSNEHGAPLA